MLKIKQVVQESKELMCLVNSKDLIAQITKLGLLPFYPNFDRHFKTQKEADAENENVLKL